MDRPTERRWWTVVHRSKIHVASPVSSNARTWCGKTIRKPGAFSTQIIGDVTCEECLKAVEMMLNRLDKNTST